MAKWKDPNKEYCTVTFKESDDKKTTQTVEKGTAATKPTDPTKDGYTFLGWYNGDIEFDFSTQITADIALTAKWEPVATKPDDGEGLGDDGGDKKPDESSEPVISGPVASGVRNLKASHEELETAYITWTAADNAKWYNVYVSPNPASADSWVKLDGPLVRQYANHFRADALGLAKGTYDMKVVPVSGEDKEATEYASTATGITVNAHERAGYGFVNGTSSGAYNDDGTLKSNARVLYITAETKDKVSLDVQTSNKGKLETGNSLQAILNLIKKGYDDRPLVVRFVGNITDLADMDKGDIVIENKRNAKAGITFEGVGNDATINGWGIRVKGASNIEIRNLGIMNCDSEEGDNIGMQQDNDHIWVHNCDFFYGHAGSDKDQVKGDGALDSKGSDYCTYSYNHFWDNGKCNLLGNGSSESVGEGGATHITYHHNWYDHSDSRHPRIRIATVHTYNNYFDGNAKYGVGVTMGASAFVENNYFRSTSSSSKAMMISLQGTDAKGDGTFSGEGGGMIKGYGNTFDMPYKPIPHTEDATEFDYYAASTRNEVVPESYKTKSGKGGGNTTYNNFDTAADMYEYFVDTAEQAREKVVRYAGRVGGGDLKWEFNNATEDKNYEVIPGLKSAVTGYTASVVKIGGGTASTTPGGNTGTGNEEEEKPPVTPSTPIEGEVKFVPSATGSGFTVSGNTDSSASDKTVDGVYVGAGKALKIETATSITFTTDKEMTLTIYLDGNNIKVDSTKITSSSTVDGLSVITVELASGTHTLTKVDKGVLYLIKLTPKS